MGSAVTKPLTRRRGKVKTNESAVNSANWNVEKNVNDNCQPSVDCLEDSLADVKNLPESINGKPAARRLLETCPKGINANTVKERIGPTPLSTPDKTGRQYQSRTAAHVNVNKGVLIFNRCFLSGMCVPLHQPTSPRMPASSESSANNKAKQQSQTILDATAGRTSSSSQSRMSPRTYISANTSGILVKAAKNMSSIETNSPAALAVHTNGLSSDQIGNIRKQLYTEGLNPAEREGGVAFFIPVTEDGMQPLTDGAVVAERLTKTKKASLNYEERMILANINRQAQLSKRKEFAVRDIRNVKGAASATDVTDKTKQDDETNADCDVSAAKNANTDMELEASLTKRVYIDAEFDASDLSELKLDAEYNISFSEEESL